MKNNKERRLFTAFTITIAILFVMSCSHTSSVISLRDNEVTALWITEKTDPDDAEFKKAKLREALNALSKAHTLTLYALEPEAYPSSPLLTELEEKKFDNLPYSPPPQYLHGILSLGKTYLKGEDAKIASQEFRRALDVPYIFVIMCDCYEPRHALRAEYNDHIYDFVLCYGCGEMRIYKNGEELLKTLATMGSDFSKMNALLKKHNVPLPYIYTEQAKIDYEASKP